MEFCFCFYGVGNCSTTELHPCSQDGVVKPIFSKGIVSSTWAAAVWPSGALCFTAA